MATGEGGMITTNSDALADRLRLIRNHGDTGKYNHISLGYNYRMTNIQGAIGSGQLRRLEGFIARRIENAEALNKAIKIDGLTVPFRMADVRHVYNQYVLRVEDDFPVSREKLMEYLQANGIASAVHYPKAVYEQPLYRELGYGRDSCPVAEDVSRRVMSLPVHPGLSASDIEYIADTINSFED
jgi:perosamine synthetase